MIKIVLLRKFIILYHLITEKEKMKMIIFKKLRNQKKVKPKEGRMKELTELKYGIKSLESEKLWKLQVNLCNTSNNIILLFNKKKGEEI